MTLVVYCAGNFSLNSLDKPKSQSFRSPCRVSKMFEGFLRAENHELSFSRGAGRGASLCAR